MKFSSENRQQEFLGITLMLIGVVLRLLPHPENFTPVTAIALFSGVVLSPAIALTVPLLVMIATDMIIGPHPLFLLTWGSFFAVSLIGVAIKKNARVGRIFLGSLSGSLLFFIVTNLGVFLFQNMYPKNFSGFFQCYWMAIPFFRNSLAGDLFFNAVLFGVFAAVKNYSVKLSKTAGTP